MLEIRDYQRELQRFRNRLLLGAAFVLALFFVLAVRFVYLQVVRHDHYLTLAESNRITVIPVVPSRGIITDRNGVVLAHNFSDYTLEITPSKVGNLEKTIDALAEFVDIQPKDRKRFKRLLEESKNFESISIRNRLSETEAARFAANRWRFPGVEIKARPFRHYPQAELFSHVIGYIGRVNVADLEALEERDELANYRGTDHIGKTGIEQSYERELHGTTGYEQVETDAGGRAVRVLSRRAPTSGNNLRLTLDAKLQEVAYKAFGNFRGGLVAIDPSNGEVLALVSKPGFDPNLFVDGIDPGNWDALNNSPDKPMNNRALRGVYPPGSTFKPFMAMAGLYYNKRSPAFTISDPGYYTLAGSSHQYRDWKKGGHGSVDMVKSIIISCDTYYYGLGVELGIDNIYNFISQFGFGERTGIDIEGESRGLLPSQEWKQKRFKQKWFAGDTVSVSIGQGYNLATPMQLAYGTAILAKGGETYKPHLLKGIEDAGTRQVKEIPPPVLRKIDLKPEHLAVVWRGMEGVAQPGGTAGRAFAGAAYTSAGKTGTAQVIGMKQGEKYDEKRVAERHRDHALYIAYAPAENPRIALGILVENGGHGGSTAAPIARIVFDYWLTGKLPPEAGIGEGEEEAEDE
jgi:penicillin-binding protein 2